MRSFPGQVGLGFGVITEDAVITPPEPTSQIPFIVAKQTLREMLARSSTFQTAIEATGTTSQKIAAAKLRIYLSAYISDTLERPFAVICKNESDKQNAIGGGDSTTFLPAGSLDLRLEKVIPDEFLTGTSPNQKLTEGSEGDAEEDFEDFYEGCLADINALAGKSGYLFIRGWDTIEGPSLFESAGAQQNVYMIRKLCNWGIE